MIKMRQISLLILITFLFVLHGFTQNNVTSPCNVLKQTSDFSSDSKPSLKKLKKMVGVVSNDEVLDYAIYLNDFLAPNPKFPRFYCNPKIVSDYILPNATIGNIKAISFLSGKRYWQNSEALTYISKNTLNNSASKFMKFQLLFLLSKDIEDARGYYNLNKYYFAQDSLLVSYFKDFNKEDLLRVKDLIDDKISQINKFKEGFDLSSYDYENIADKRNSTLEKMPIAIDDKSFCLSFTFASIKYNGMLSIVPKAFDGSTIQYDAEEFLKILRGSIDILLVNENPKSLAQILMDYKKGELQGQWKFDYMNPKNQYFSNDKVYGPVIFKLLSAILPYDTAKLVLKQKSYYLNRAAQFGATDAYFNLACLYQVIYYNTNTKKYNDSCIFYIEKLIPINNTGALTLKGIKVFNGEGYIQNKEQGVKLILKAQSLGGRSAKELIETLPQKLFSGVNEGYYFNQSVKIKDPWDFKVLCSNNCGKYTYPDKIIFSRIYDNNSNFPKIERAAFFEDGFGNPTINISEYDFKNTFTIAHMGNTDWKHDMCSATCQLAHENKNNKNWNQIKAKRNQIDNKETKCIACSKVMKRKDMLSVSECPCYTESGNSINLSYTQSYDIYGDSEPKACSSECQINFCKTKCSAKGYTFRY